MTIICSVLHNQVTESKGHKGRPDPPACCMGVLCPRYTGIYVPVCSPCHSFYLCSQQDRRQLYQISFYGQVKKITTHEQNFTKTRIKHSKKLCQMLICINETFNYQHLFVKAMQYIYLTI